jgi:hypothetical protein
MVNQLDPCILSDPAPLLDSSNFINGGSVDSPVDDSNSESNWEWNQSVFQDEETTTTTNSSIYWKCVQTEKKVIIDGNEVTKQIKTCIPTTEITPYKTVSECIINCALKEILPPTPSPNVVIDQTTTSNEYTENYNYTDEILNYVDPEYQRLINTDFSKNNTFSGSSTVFTSNIDFSISKIEGTTLTKIKDLNKNIAKIKTMSMKEYINETFRDILYNLHLADGRKISDLLVDDSIRKFLLTGTTSLIDISFVVKLQAAAVFSTQSLISTERSQRLAASYGVTRDQLLKDRLKSLISTINLRKNSQQIQPIPIRALARANQKKISLNPSRYTDEKKELLKLWYILPEDLYAKAIIEDANKIIQKVKINNDATLSVTTSAGVISFPKVNEYTYKIPVTTEIGLELVPIDSQIDRIYTINNKVEQACLFDLGAEKRSKLTVSSVDASNLEFTYPLAEQVSSHYVLILDASTIQDVSEPTSPFVRLTSAKYKLESDDAVIASTIKFRAYPWQVLPINYNDPILGHIKPTSQYEVQFTNYSLNKFTEDIEGDIFVRRIPKVIILLPTDKYKYLLYNGTSKLTNWNVRELFFTLSVDPSQYETTLRSGWGTIERTYPSTDIDNIISDHGLKNSYETSSPLLRDGFKITQPSRSAHPFRSLYNIVSGLNDSYILNGGLEWKDVLRRLTPQEYKGYNINISNKIFQKLVAGDRTGVKLYHTPGQSNINSRLVELKANKTDMFTIYLEI